jgi:UDP-N-acetylglucosamine transferase subunit ALG13
VTSLVLALVGTDHHPFDRLVDWMDDAARRHRGARFVVQHGASREPLVAEGHAFLDQGRLHELLDAASVVVCHGGPGTIMDARSAGHLPLCVPRDPALGEHVDGHQQRFVGLVGTAGVVRAAPGAAEFAAALDLALAVGGTRSPDPHVKDPATELARRLLADELDGLVLSRRGARHRRPRLLR